MLNFTNSGPIIACSSGTSENSAIGIIRISFNEDFDKFKDSFSCDLNSAKARYAYFCKLLDYTNNEILDEILLLKFVGPNSYTGENILELHVHGNQLNISRIIDYFIRQYGVELAKPGEFSYRAYLNRKLDTLQLESLEQFLNASNTFALKQGISGLNGELYASYQLLKESYLNLRAVVEMGIDFIDDMGEEKFNALFSERLNTFNSLVNQFYQRSNSNFSSLLNPSIVLIGEPNAGKSTFFNNFLKFDRSIVSNIAGTTRDTISEYISINGNTFKLVDTAGIRETSDSIEKEGVTRAKSHLENCFFSIHLINLMDLNNFNSSLSCDLIVFTHSDHKNFKQDFSTFLRKNKKLRRFMFANETGPIGPIFQDIDGPIEPDLFFNTGPIGPTSSNGPIEPSQLINNFKEIEGLVSEKFNSLTKENPITSSRQRFIIEKIHNIWEKDINNKCLIGDIALFSHEFSRLGPYISELLGITTPDNVLNHVFSNFCIGK